MRYHKNISVDFDCDVDENRRVAPLFFIILLENAFKHGVENLRKDAYVKINLVTAKKQVSFKVENNYEKNENITGIGLKNLKRRLELTYPKQHKLILTETAHTYQAQLILYNND